MADIAASVLARLKNPFSTDFGVGDVIVPKQEKRKIPTQLDDLFSSRMKDYYDIYLIGLSAN